MVDARGVCAFAGLLVFGRAGMAARQEPFAREAVMKVGQEGMRWVCGADGVSDAEMMDFEQALKLTAIHQTQKGMLADMDYLTDVIYQRK